MKKLIAMMLAIEVVVGCSNHPKSRIEERFEQYAQENFYNPKDFEGFSAVTQTDSFNVIEIGYGCIIQSDTINNMLLTAAKNMNKKLFKAPFWIAAQSRDEGVSIALRNLDDSNRWHERSERKRKLTELLEDIDSTKAVNRIYILKARIKNKTEIVPYYAVDCAVIDSILISDKPIQRNEVPDSLKKVLDLIDVIVEENRSRLKLVDDIIKFTETLQTAK